MDHRKRRAGAEFDRKIAVGDRVKEFSLTVSNPSSRATLARSIGKEVPASAAAPSGRQFTRRRQSARRARSRSNISKYASR